jgi:hypothetical protein
MKDRVETLGEVACDVLQRLVRELLVRKSGGHLVERQLQRLDLRLPLALRGAEADPSVSYCHRCQSASCEHGMPPSCRHVFVGYAATGIPRWEDFAQHCLDRKHPAVDRLYEDPPAFLTLVQQRPRLHDGMLEAFQNGAYELMGQVVAGFFPLRVRAEEGRGVLALTVQVAVSRPQGSPLRIGLNLLGRAPGGEELDRLWERLDELPWRKAVRWAQGALQTVRPSRGGRRADPSRPELDREQLEQRIEGIMRGLARRLERDQRARTRRTRHAEERHASGRRPTRKAVADARTAGPESLKVDERSGTLVVLGEKGRTHFFGPEGQLVSSVRYSKDAIVRKLKTGLWRQASDEEVADFLQRLRD